MQCPRNGIEYGSVEKKTLVHHLKTPWSIELGDKVYFFCDDPECDVVYFSEDGRLFNRDDLRTVVGQKNRQDDKILCYCFGVSAEDYRKDESLKDFVTEMTKAEICACDVRNPSGKCCLKDFNSNS